MIEYRDLQGAPFVDGGRDPVTGLDCWGLLMVVMERFGKTVPDFRISCFDTEGIGSMFNRQTGGESPWRKVDEPGEARIVALKLDPYADGMVQHYGVCLDRRRFIHTLKKAGVIVTRLDHRYFKNKVVGYYEWTG